MSQDQMTALVRTRPMIVEKRDWKCPVAADVSIQALQAALAPLYGKKVDMIGDFSTVLRQERLKVKECAIVKYSPPSLHRRDGSWPANQLARELGIFKHALEVEISQMRPM